jgi:hypothetical protein
MITLYYSNPEEKDLVEEWTKYGTKMGFTTSSQDLTDWLSYSNTLQYCTSTDASAKNASYDYDTICTTSNTGKLSVDYSDATVTQGTTSSLYPWNYAKSNSWDCVKSNYTVDPVQLETEHRKVKQIIKFK